MKNQMVATMTAMQHFTVQIAAGATQTSKRHATFAAFAHGPDFTGKVPASFNALAARAKPGECTRLRCLSKACQLRSAEEREALDCNTQDTAQTIDIGWGIG